MHPAAVLHKQIFGAVKRKQRRDAGGIDHHPTENDGALLWAGGDNRIARVGGNGTDAGAHIVHTINDGVQNGSLADAPEKQTHNAQDLDSATHDDHDAYTAEAGAQPVGDQGEKRVDGRVKNSRAAGDEARSKNSDSIRASG